MKISIDKYKILYLDKEKCMYSIILSTLLYIFVFTIFGNVPSLKYAVISIVYLIGACTIFLLSQSILSIYSKSYYRTISIMYILIAMFCMLKIVPNELIHSQVLVILRNDCLLRTMYMQVLIFAFHNTLSYVNTNIKKVKIYIIFIVSILIFLFNYICLVNNMDILLFITNLFNLLFLCIDVEKLKSIKTNVGNVVNVVKLLVYLNLTITILNLLSLVESVRRYYMNPLGNIVVFVQYILLLVFLMEKLINRPYRLLFTDLYKENQEMDILNGKVVKKNRELEFTQAIIRKKERMFKTFFVNVPVPLVMISKNGRIIFANSSFQRLIEESNIKNIINKKIFKIIDINERNNIKALISKESNEISGKIICGNSKKYVDIDVMEVSGEENTALVILNDVTARVKVGKLRTTMENNKFQEKIKSDFLSNISHDLKTPINVIYSAAQLVTIFIEQDNKKSLEKYNMICKLNCFGLIRLTNNLIDSSRIYSDYLSANLQVKNIVQVIEEIVMSLVDYAKSKNIHLVFDTDEEELYVKFDEEFMQRVIINLVSNSIKFTNENGKIEVIIHNSNDEVVINVRDNGVGMEKEFIENAFKRYTMGKNNYKNAERGSGIGLFVVKKLIEKQNGKINIESEVNKGTDVEIKFNKET